MIDEALEHLVKGIVDNPDDVAIALKDHRRGTTLEVRVNPEDIGKVIGRNGRTARALRTVFRVTLIAAAHPPRDLPEAAGPRPDRGRCERLTTCPSDPRESPCVAPPGSSPLPRSSRSVSPPAVTPRRSPPRRRPRLFRYVLPRRPPR